MEKITQYELAEIESLLAMEWHEKDTPMYKMLTVLVKLARNSVE